MLLAFHTHLYDIKTKKQNQECQQTNKQNKKDLNNFVFSDVHPKSYDGTFKYHSKPPPQITLLK